MKIAVYSLTYWYTQEEADSKQEELLTWKKSIEKCIGPDYLWLVSGTYSDPSYSQMPVPILNTGINKTHGNDFLYWSYANLAHTYGIYHALMNTNCDLCAQFSSDSVVNIDYRPILKEFMDRPEIVCAPKWNNWIEDAAIFYKREGMLKYISQRKRASLVEPGTQPEPMTTEAETMEIFKGQWWNPWPQYLSLRQEYGYAQKYPEWCHMTPSEQVITEDWPIVIRPAPDIVKRANEIWQKF